MDKLERLGLAQNISKTNTRDTTLDPIQFIKRRSHHPDPHYTKATIVPKNGDETKEIIFGIEYFTDPISVMNSRPSVVVQFQSPDEVYLTAFIDPRARKFSYVEVSEQGKVKMPWLYLAESVSPDTAKPNGQNKIDTPLLEILNQGSLEEGVNTLFSQIRASIQKL